MVPLKMNITYYNFRDNRYPVYGTGITAKNNSLLEAFYIIYGLNDMIRPNHNYSDDPTQNTTLYRLVSKIKEYNKNGFDGALSDIDEQEKNIIEELANVYNSVGVLLTGQPNLDMIILNRLDDNSLNRICQTNQEARKICNTDSFWTSRTVDRYGLTLGGADKIREDYLRGRSWQQYYQDVSTSLHQVKTPIHLFKNIYTAEELGYTDLLLLYIDRVLLGNHAALITNYAILNNLDNLINKLVERGYVRDETSVDQVLNWAKTQNRTDIVSLVVGHEDIEISDNTLFDILGWATENNYHNLVLFMLQKGVFPANYEDNYMIQWAASKGHKELLNELISRGADKSIDNNNPIRLAAAEGYPNIIYVLIEYPSVNPTANNNEAIIMASRNGHLGAVKALLLNNRVDPAARNNTPIIYASANGQADVVDFLLGQEGVDPSAQDNSALLEAASNGHLTVVDRLLRDPRVVPTQDMLLRAVMGQHERVANRLIRDPRVTLTPEIIDYTGDPDIANRLAQRLLPGQFYYPGISLPQGESTRIFRGSPSTGRK